MKPHLLLVDPGWSGRLSFPLHNLTTNDYWFEAGEEIIWIEFTKVSLLEEWKNADSAPTVSAGQYRPYPENKRGGSVQSRLTAAVPHDSIRSSLEEAYERAEDAARLTNRIQVWGATALVVGLATIVALAVDVIAFRSSSDRTPAATTTAVVTTPAPAPQVSRADFQRLQRQINQLRARLRRAGG